MRALAYSAATCWLQCCFPAARIQPTRKRTSNLSKCPVRRSRTIMEKDVPTPENSSWETGLTSERESAGGPTVKGKSKRCCASAGAREELDTSHPPGEGLCPGRLAQGVAVESVQGMIQPAPVSDLCNYPLCMPRNLLWQNDCQAGLNSLQGFSSK